MTRKLLGLLFLPLFLLIFVSTVNAVESTTKENAQTATTGSAPTTITDPSVKLKEQMELVQKQKNVEANKANEEAMTIVKAKREEFNIRVQTIKDQKKKTLIEKIDTKLTKINENQVTKFSGALISLQGFLDKIKQTTDTKVLSDVTAAQTAIDTAKAALDMQATNTYIMDIVDDATLKINAGTIVSQFRQDLTALYKLVVEAKQIVQKLNTDRESIKNEATRRLPDGNPSTSSAK